MQINNVQLNPSFKKRLVANANVLKDNQPYPVSIYEITKKEDKNYFKKLTTDDKWSMSNFIEDIAYYFKHCNSAKFRKFLNLKFYTMENNEGTCLGIATVDDFKYGKQNIKYIESIPENSKKRQSDIFSNKNDLRYKYIGETMIAFLTKQQKIKKKPKQIVVKHPQADARNFYLKSYFCFDDKEMFLGSMHLPLYNEDSLIEDNEKHTQSKIEIIEGKKKRKNIHFSPSFQKRLMATTSLKDYCGDKVPCKIYELDSQEDALYIEQQSNRADWIENDFLNIFYKNFAKDKYYKNPDINFYTLENEKGDLFAYVEELKTEKTRNILFLETVPTMAKNSKVRAIKGIGETMLTFLAALAQENGSSQKLWVDFPSNNSHWFYEKIGFKKPFSMCSSMYLPIENVDSLICKNEKRNGSKIEFVEDNNDK